MDGKTDMMAVSSLPRFTFKMAMAALNCSRSTLYRLMWSKKLRGYKVGSTWRFREEDLAKVAEPTEAPKPPCIA